jgi:hypothetical protein
LFLFLWVKFKHEFWVKRGQDLGKKETLKIAQRNQNDWWMKDVWHDWKFFPYTMSDVLLVLYYELALESWLVDQGIHF